MNYNRHVLKGIVSAFLASSLCGVAAGQDLGPPATGPSVADQVPQFTLQPVLVTAEKREQDPQDVPISLTAINHQTIQDAQIQNIREASRYVPNLNIQHFTAARESFPFIRGIGSGQNSPAVTTYIDGVPQLTFSTSNIQLVDIDRIEFLRGPQGTLYGRNTLGGVINIYTQQPGDVTHGDLTLSGGNYALQDYRGGIRGAVVPGKIYYAFAGGYINRDGYTTNTFTGNQLDNVNDVFGRFELRFTPTPDWDLRLTMSGEQDHDGDFALSDLRTIRSNPNHVSHDYTGLTRRNIGQVAFNAIYHGDEADFTSVTALQYWKSLERTDLDATAFDLLRRDNQEQHRNVVEELRLSSPNAHPTRINDQIKLQWIAGTLIFASGDEPRIGNEARSPLVSQGLPTPFTTFQNSNLNNVGVSIYGQETLTFFDKLDFTLGGRVDYEHADGDVRNTASTPFIPASSFSGTRDDTQFSPRIEVGYHWTPNLLTYASATEGYKAGGFNSTAPNPGAVSFGPERSWSYEVGAKSSFLDDRLTLNADVFYINWKRLQLDTPIANQPSSFFITNSGEAHSTGFEVEGNYQLNDKLGVFAGMGLTHARFDHAIQPNGQSADGKRLPQAPETTWNVGSQLTVPLPHDLRFYVRAEVNGVGPYSYDATNIAGQGSYILTNFRIGVGDGWWRLEGWVNNAFNSHYVPIAFQFPLAQSGYVGESGDPTTAGVTLGLTF